MFMPAKGEIQQGPEQAAGFTVEKIGLGELVELEHEIRQLPFNVIANEDESIHEKNLPVVRREALKYFHEQLRQSAEHEAVYLAKDGTGKVKAFCFIELKPNGREARVKAFWSALRESSQKDIVEKFLDAARRDLPADRYPHLIVEADQEAKHLRHLAANEKYNKFVIFKDVPAASKGNVEVPETASEKESLEKTG